MRNYEPKLRWVKTHRYIGIASDWGQKYRVILPKHQVLLRQRQGIPKIAAGFNPPMIDFLAVNKTNLSFLEIAFIKLNFYFL
ncbi:MAG: hypothetical protein LBP87_08000 [Planctomycetaceae bacterium]|jgi:hypothetical protein|nr:hypothetical protein [Planctomycetaceae bacterium]